MGIEIKEIEDMIKEDNKVMKNRLRFIEDKVDKILKYLEDDKKE